MKHHSLVLNVVTALKQLKLLQVKNNIMMSVDQSKTVVVVLLSGSVLDYITSCLKERTQFRAFCLGYLGSHKVQFLVWCYSQCI